MANWISPVDGSVSQDYGVKDSGYEAGYHTGMDFSVPSGTGVVAVQNGKVVEAGWSDSYGNYVKIRHPNGDYSLYAHLDKLNVKVGQKVDQTEQIGLSGNTGNSNGAHLHFEVRSGSGSYSDDVNPNNFIGGRGTYQNTGNDTPDKGHEVGNQDGGGGGNGGNGGGNDGGGAGNFKAMLAAAGWPAYLIEQFPELEKIFKEALNKEWTPERFIGEVMNSRFYQNRSDSMLAWDKMRETQQDALIDGTSATLADQASAMGIQIGDKRLKGLAVAINRFGLNESQVQDLIAKELDRKEVPKGGTVGTAMDQIQQVAWDWGVNMSPQLKNKWEQKIASGDADIQAFKDMAEARARKDYHWLNESFDAGKTLGDIADPYRQSMASLLEVSPDSISMKDKQIRKALSYTTGQGKKAEEGLAPLWQFEDELRKDPRWAVTTNARDSAMNFGMKVLQDFGVIA